jgi:cytochrome P450
MADVLGVARPRPGASPHPAGEARPRLLGVVPHADVWEAARDNETFSSAQGLTVNYGELELIGLQDNPPFVMQDPPVHTEFRKLVSRASPRGRSRPSSRRFVSR